MLKQQQSERELLWRQGYEGSTQSQLSPCGVKLEIAKPLWAERFGGHRRAAQKRPNARQQHG
jgi:hypothetical protein